MPHSQSMIPFLTIILPTYNRAKLIKRSIDSILSQDFKDFELLIIDDGSTDHTPELLQEYEDERIKIFTKSNGGVSSARNLDLKHAKGEYITFIDSDDYILQGFFQDAWKLLRGGGIDVLIYGGKILPQIQIAELFSNPKHKIINDFELICDKNFIYEYCSFLGNPWACAKFIKKELITKNQICFDESIHYDEDLLFNLNFLYHAQSVGLCKKLFYMCDTSTQSLCRGVSKNTKIQNLLMGYEKVCLSIQNQQVLKYCAFMYFSHLLMYFGPLDFLRKTNQQKFLNLLKQIPINLLETNKIYRLIKTKKYNANFYTRLIIMLAINSSLRKISRLFDLPLLKALKPKLKLFLQT